MSAYSLAAVAQAMVRRGQAFEKRRRHRVFQGEENAWGRLYLFGRDVGGHNAWGDAQVLTAFGSLGDVTFGSAVDLSSDGRTVLVATAPSAYSGLAAKVFAFSR